MENEICGKVAERVRNAKRVTIEFTDDKGYQCVLKLEPFVFKYIASALKTALFVKEKMKGTGGMFYQ